MSTHGYGIEAHSRRHDGEPPPKQPARYLVLIVDATGTTVARLFDAERRPVGDFDAGAEEVAVMTQGIAPAQGAQGAEWDHALSGHSADERRAAEVYTLDV
jgi:hypothetical protein